MIIKQMKQSAALAVSAPKAFVSKQTMMFFVRSMTTGRKGALNMDQLASFAVLALFLFVIVKNSSTANDLFSSVLNAVKTNITNLFSSMGGF